MQIGTEALALLNAFYQTNELLAFFGETKELGDETGCAAYDETKMLVEGYSVQFLLMGFEQWLKEKALQTPQDMGERKTSKTEGKKEGSRASAKGLSVHEFEDYLTKTLGGEGSFKVGGREFDGRVGNRWWEAKSGNYWNMLEETPKELANFKSSMGQRLGIAKENGATLELFSNTPIPEAIKQWLIKKGIPFTELLD